MPFLACKWTTAPGNGRMHAVNFALQKHTHALSPSFSVQCRFLRIFLIKEPRPIDIVKDAAFMLLLMGMWRRGLVNDARKAAERNAACTTGQPARAPRGKRKSGEQGAAKQPASTKAGKARDAAWKPHFLTQETATDIIVACMVAILAVKAYRVHCPHVKLVLSRCACQHVNQKSASNC